MRQVANIVWVLVVALAIITMHHRIYELEHPVEIGTSVHCLPSNELPGIFCWEGETP